MKSSVIVFPGSNCDRDTAIALEKMQFKNQMVWHKETKLPKSDLIVVPGGFSYGDYLRSGAIAGKSLIIDEVIKVANEIGTRSISSILGLILNAEINSLHNGPAIFGRCEAAAQSNLPTDAAAASLSSSK